MLNLNTMRVNSNTPPALLRSPPLLRRSPLICTFADGEAADRMGRNV